MNQLRLQLGFLGHILEENGDRNQLSLFVENRIVGQIEGESVLGLPALENRLAPALYILDRAVSAGFITTMEARKTLVVQSLVPGLDHFLRQTIVVQQHVVVGVDEKNRVGHRFEGFLPLFLRP